MPMYEMGYVSCTVRAGAVALRSRKSKRLTACAHREYGAKL